MAEITAALVKDLREKSGAGMMDCKKALAENDGDVEAAMDWLRTKGLAKAAKKADRVAAEGLVGVAARRRRAARWSRSTPRPTSSPATRRSRRWCARSPALAPARRRRRRALLGARGRRQRPDGRGGDHQPIATIGENMVAAPHGPLAVEQGVVAGYIHNAAGARPRQDRRAGGAANPPATRRSWPSSASRSRCTWRRPARWRVDASDLDPAVVERERAIFTEQARASRQAREDHREDGRGPDPQVLRGSRAAQAGLRHEPGPDASSRLVAAAAKAARRAGRGDGLRPHRPRRRRGEAGATTSPPRSRRWPAAERASARQARPVDGAPAIASDGSMPMMTEAERARCHAIAACCSRCRARR